MDRRTPNAERKHRLNREIMAPQVRLNGVENEPLGIVPTIEAHVSQLGRVPEGIAFGFAMFLLLMRGELQERLRAEGHGAPKDDQAEHFHALWSRTGGTDANLAEFVRQICAERELWDRDLNEIPGWTEAVTEHLVRGYQEGAPAALDAFLETASLPEA